MRTPRPFRFGLQASFTSTGPELRELARRAEGAGFDVLTIADHLGLIDPFIGATVAAEATSTLRVGTHVLNIDFHPAALLARAAATIDLTSEGRFELGLGTGYAAAEYEQAGLAFDSPGRRIERVRETVQILRALFAGDEVGHTGPERPIRGHTLAPLPPQGADLPFLIGGNGDRILEVAARHADIVGFTGFGHAPGAPAPTLSHMTSAGLADRVAHVASFGRAPELQALIQRVVVTDDRDRAAEEISAEVTIGAGGAAAIIESPFLLVGSVDQICDELRERRASLGLSYFTVFAGRASPGIDAIVGRLAGT